MSYVHMTSTLADADDSFHSGVTTALRGNVLHTQSMNRTALHCVFMSSLSQIMSTDFRYFSTFIPVAWPVRSRLGSSTPRQLKVILDAKQSSAGASAVPVTIRLYAQDNTARSSIDGDSGVLGPWPSAEFTLSTFHTTYALHSTSVTPNLGSNPWVYFTMAADKAGNHGAKLYIRALYIRETAT